MRIAVIGAGASGLPAIKSAIEDGCEVQCFEMSNDIGGLWRYKPNACPGEGTVMKTTVINTSKEMTAYSDFPPPKDAANFMHNAELLDYFRSYAERFDLLKHIRFEHKVISIRRNIRFAETGQWDVEWLDLRTNNTATEVFDGVMVCTGHHVNPYWPEPFPGQASFRGRLVHSHDYKDHLVYLATRSGSWVMNRVWDGGEPADLAFLSRFMFALKALTPRYAQNYFLERKLNKRFDHGRFGLKPSHHVLSAHVTINDELPNRIISGTVVIKPNLGSFTSTGVVFEDGTEVPQVDTVIFATGFSFDFPLVEDGNLIPVKENHVDLYKYMYPAQLSPKNTLAVIGLIQPTGSIMPISEMQTRVFVAALTGRIRLPSKEKMEKDIKRKHAQMAKEFIASRRHTIQVYYVEIMDELAELLGCKPSLFSRIFYDPKLANALYFHGLVPYQYRLQGPHSWKGAREAILTFEDRVFNATRTRRTKETLQSKPPIKMFHVLRLID
ncbi:unnamed protein product [Nippostrongylus brasiliensis]|uniref:Flavin-containing monooxygenase n=1 Tax=Nippostrongylus brasiliensis TaxID=27835 RepID=A0A158QYS0_NIPBR|nr:unnamed protein product [Nippostrongylus brasiliensis]